MSAPCTEPAAIRHEIGGTIVETIRRTDGWWLYRCPEIVRSTLDTGVDISKASRPQSRISSRKPAFRASRPAGFNC